MGLFAGILGAVGSLIAPGVGTAIGGAIGGAIDGDRARSSANQAADNSNQFNANQAGVTREFNAEQAQLNRDFQSAQTDKVMAYDTAMSNSAYQRATADMKAAGLNPMLAYSQGGASSPTVSAPSGSAASAGATATSVDRIQAVNTALAATKQAQDNRESDSRIAVNNADVQLKNAQTNREMSSASNIDQQTVGLKQQMEETQSKIINIQHDTDNKLVENALLKAKAALVETQTALTSSHITLAEAQTRYENIRTVLANLARPEAENAANAQDSWWMKNISPFLPDFAKSVGAAGVARSIK